MSDFESRVSLHFKLLVEKEMNRLIGSTPSTPSVTTENSESTSKSFDSQLSAEFVFQVQCKLAFRYCKLSPDFSGNVYTGSVVIISAEKAGTFDLGVVVNIYTDDSFAQKLVNTRPFNDREEAEIRSIVRLADRNDLQLLPFKHQKEEVMMAKCRHHAHNVLKLPIDVYGAELQIDGQMLTFYYTSDVRADFRALVRAMFNLFMVRIKMRKTNQCKKFVPVAFATAILRTGVR